MELLEKLLKYQLFIQEEFPDEQLKKYQKEFPKELIQEFRQDQF